MEVMPYQELLKFGRDHARVQLHAGRLPNNVIQRVTNFGFEDALNDAFLRKYVELDENCRGSKDRYNVFESLITGRDAKDKSTPPNNKFKTIFDAHIVSESTLAQTTVEILK